MKVKDLLSSPEKWHKGCYAKDTKGNPVSETGSTAVSWCLMGAIYKCYDNGAGYKIASSYGNVLSCIRKIEDNFPDLLRRVSLPCFNDDPKTTFEDIRRIIETADI